MTGWDDHEHAWNEGGSFLAMTEDMHVVVTCPIPWCPWAGLMQAQWNPLIEVRSLVDFVEGHVKAAHPDLTIGDSPEQQEYVQEMGKHVSGQIGMMMARMTAVRDRTCFAWELREGDQKSDGVLSYSLRQQAIESGDCEKFDGWWTEAMKHAADHDRREKGVSLTNLSRWLKEIGLLDGEKPDESS